MSPAPSYNEMLASLRQEMSAPPTAPTQQDYDTSPPHQQQQQPDATDEVFEYYEQEQPLIQQQPPATELPTAPSEAKKGPIAALRANLRRYAFLALLLVALVKYGLPWLSQTANFGLNGQLTTTGLVASVAGPVIAMALGDAFIPDLW